MSAMIVWKEEARVKLVLLCVMHKPSVVPGQYLLCSNSFEWIVCRDAAGGHRQGAAAILLEEALRPVQEVAN